MEEQNHLDSRDELGSRDELNYGSVRIPGITQACAIYSVVVAAFLLIGYRVQARELYSGLLVTEFLLVLLPPLILLLVGRYDLKKVLRLNRIKVLDGVVIFFLMLSAIPVAGVFNAVNLWLVNRIFGKVSVLQLPVAESLEGLLVNVLVFAGSAAICEEFLFRGVVQRSLERLGTVKAILIAAFLFGLMHLDFQRLLGTFLLGALIGFIVSRTNSLFSGMLAHFTNNAAAVVLSFALTWVARQFGNGGQAMPGAQEGVDNLFKTLESMPREQLMIVLVVYAFLFFLLFTVFALLLFAFIRITRGRAAKEIPGLPAMTGAKAYTRLLWALPGVALVALIYFVEVFRFRGIHQGFIDTITRLLGVQ